MPYEPKPCRVAHKDFQRFDEVSIKTVERFKESHLSGDEWRYNAHVELKKNGKVIKIASFYNVEMAALALPALMNNLIQPEMSEGEANHHAKVIEEGCDQEGCSNPATNTHMLKKRYTKYEGQEYPVRKEGEYRRFCDKHSTRGDCGLEDADSNYEVVSDSEVRN